MTKDEAVKTIGLYRSKIEKIEKQVRLFTQLPPEIAGRILSAMNHKDIVDILSSAYMSYDNAAKILSNMSPDVSAMLISNKDDDSINTAHINIITTLSILANKHMSINAVSDILCNKNMSAIDQFVILDLLMDWADIRLPREHPIKFDQIVAIFSAMPIDSKIEILFLNQFHINTERTVRILEAMPPQSAAEILSDVISTDGDPNDFPALILSKIKKPNMLAILQEMKEDIRIPIINNRYLRYKISQSDRIRLS